MTNEGLRPFARRIYHHWKSRFDKFGSAMLRNGILDDGEGKRPHTKALRVPRSSDATCKLTLSNALPDDNHQSPQLHQPRPTHAFLLSREGDLDLGLAVDLVVVQCLFRHSRAAFVDILDEGDVLLGRNETNFVQVRISEEGGCQA